jgi:probable HAF family extracellular repeat protein
MTTTYNFNTLNIFPSGTYGAQAYDINNLGQIVGSYADSSGVQHGFLYSNGTFTTLDVLSVGPGTQAFGINDAGQIVGEYFGTNNGGIGWGGDVHGFLYSASTYTPINDPLASGGTFASSINDSNQVVGLYSGSPTGFLFSGSNYSSLTPYLSGYYQITGINDLGQIVGQTFVGGLPHGFVYSNGSYTPISDPLGTNGTAVTGINNQGQIVGYYLDSSNVQHGYIYSGGTYTTVDAPLGAHGTVITGINDAGQIVGYYLDNSGAPQIGGEYSDYQAGVHYAFSARQHRHRHKRRCPSVVRSRLFIKLGT